MTLGPSLLRMSGLLFPVIAVLCELLLESSRLFMSTSKEVLGGCVESDFKDD